MRENICCLRNQVKFLASWCISKPLSVPVSNSASYCKIDTKKLTFQLSSNRLCQIKPMLWTKNQWFPYNQVESLHFHTTNSSALKIQLPWIITASPQNTSFMTSFQWTAVLIALLALICQSKSTHNLLLLLGIAEASLITSTSASLFTYNELISSQISVMVPKLIASI